MSRAIPWLIIVVLASIAHPLASLSLVAGRALIDSSAIALLLGIVARPLLAMRSVSFPAFRGGDTLLGVGVALLGSSLDLQVLVGEGAHTFLLILLTMGIGFLITWQTARWFGLSSRYATLLGVGTTICGGTAIAVTAPIIHASSEETGYSIASITLWGVVALFCYPFIGRLFHIPEQSFGIFAGVAIHSTPQVVGAAFSYSALAGQTATAVKLVRNCFIAPVALLCALAWPTKGTDAKTMPVMAQVMRAFPWFLFIFFGLSIARTAGWLNDDIVRISTVSARFAITAGMAGIGLATDFARLKEAGIRPLLVGLFGALGVGGVALVGLALFF